MLQSFRGKHPRVDPSAYVHPSAKNLVNVDQLRQTAEKIKPVELNVIIVPSLGSKWHRGNQEMRGSFGEYVLEKKLSLKNAIVITYTKSGITAYSDRVGDATLAQTEAFRTIAALHTQTTSRLANNEPAEDLIAQCVALAPGVEPGLVKFFETLRTRTRDFAPRSTAVAPPANAMEATSPADA